MASTPTYDFPDPALFTTDALLQRWAEIALEQRREMLDPDTRIGGTWLGALSFPLFETFGPHTGLDHVAQTFRDNDSIPGPSEHLLEEMGYANGIEPHHTEASDETLQRIEDFATVQAALYDYMGLPIPETRDDAY